MKVKKCSMCKKDNHIQLKHYDGQTFWVHCDCCGNTGKNMKNQKAAIDEWNRKNQQPELQT